MNFKLPKLPNLPKFSKLPKLQLPHLPTLPNFKFKKIPSFFFAHKIALITSFFLTLFITLALQYRSNFISQINSSAKISNKKISYSITPHYPWPTIEFPSPTDTANDVLGTSDYSAPTYNTSYIAPSPYPTLPPLPTIPPLPPANTSTTNNSPTTSGTGNPNCTTPSGVPNSWYSDVYPNPPITTNTGSVQLIVVIRDCFRNTVSTNDQLQISLISGDTNAKINDSSLPYTLTAQNGQTSFYVTSQISGTVTLKVTDTNKSFDITDTNNHNPVITFNSNTSNNSSCTTASGVPNAWYSDVYPSSPVPGTTGSNVSFNVILRDCNRNNVSVSDTLQISQTSNDSSFTVNGSSPPVNIQTQNGQVTFNVSSQNAGTDTFTIRDTTNSFNITDTNNHNPSVVFSGSQNTPTPGPTNTPAPNPTATSTPAPQPTTTPVPSSIPTQSSTPSPNPTGS